MIAGAASTVHWWMSCIKMIEPGVARSIVNLATASALRLLGCQSSGEFVQCTTVKPFCAEPFKTAPLYEPYGGRINLTGWPVIWVIVWLVLASCESSSAALMVVRSGCDQLWLPISNPMSAVFLTTSGRFAAFWPIRKKVAIAFFELNVSSSFGVSELGPSS